MKGQRLAKLMGKEVICKPACFYDCSKLGMGKRALELSFLGNI